MFTKFCRITALLIMGIFVFFGRVSSDSIYERDLIVKDKTRAMKVEEVFKKLLAAYEDEDAGGFLKLVSDDRFRQDYITFTDALYSDFRKYDILQVDYWIDRVVSDNVKQFVYVKWEKRSQLIDDGQEEMRQGYSRFLFDEVNGKYLLIELAGTSLFGGSLQEWRDEVGPISGSSAYDRKVNKKPDTGVEAKCETGSPENCKDQVKCEGAGGYWYDDKCNRSPEQAKCSASNPDRCLDQNSCETMADLYWYNSKCNITPEKVCDPYNPQNCKNETSCRNVGLHWYNNQCNTEAEKKCDKDHPEYCTDEFKCVEVAGLYWYGNKCHKDPQKLPDLRIASLQYARMHDYTMVLWSIENIGEAASKATQITVNYGTHEKTYDVGSIAAGERLDNEDEQGPGVIAKSGIIDSSNKVQESNENNNKAEAEETFM